MSRLNKHCLLKKVIPKYVKSPYILVCIILYMVCITDNKLIIWVDLEAEWVLI